MTGTGDEHRSAADRLIIAAAGGRTLDAAELRFVREHVAQAGFVPTPTTLASGLSGMVWQGRVLRGRDRMTPAERHYLDHVVKSGEWSAMTTLQDYLDSIRDTILDRHSRVLTSDYQGNAQLGIVGRSGRFRGERGHPLILIEYWLGIGHWVTAFQPIIGLRVLRDPRRTDIRWLRRPH
ncbi:MAG: hypothetical protein NTZ05_17610 [Chloroflexi bacterium]|nr:hypothetical protein [Chloroflexota bacterium]